jgi:hypothetical protein
MEVQNWLSQYRLDLLQTFGIVGSLLFAACSFLVDAYHTWKDEQARKISNLIATNDQYVRIWSLLFDRPKLGRIEARVVNLGKEPISPEEEVFVTMLILHMSVVFRAMQYGEIVELEGLRRDIRHFLNLPIPREVWRKASPFQNRDFVTFAQDALR